MTTLLKNFSNRLDHRFSKVYDNQTMSDWVCANTTLSGVPFSMKGYEFQRAILDDLHPNLSCIKCSQIGLSEIQIRKALGFISRNRGVAAIFTLPNENLYRRMAQTRVQPMVQKDKVFNKEQDEQSVRSMSIIQVDNSFLYLTACTEGDATSTAADVVFNDELDLSDQAMIALFNSRLQGSDWKVKQRFSTPTFEAFGIDLDYKASDQHKYLQHCDSCGHWNWPEFNTKFCIFPDLPGHIEDLMELDQDAVNEMDLSKAYVACEKCQKRLTGKREWVATYPGRTNARGYWVSPFSTDRIPLPYIVGQLLDYKKNDFIRGFHNTVLGQTFSDSKTRISLESIQSAMNKGSPNVDVPHDRPLALGIDMGATAHLVLGDAMNGNTIYLFEAIPVQKLVERVKTLMNEYNIVAGCVDRLPYTPTAEEIMRLTNHRVIPMQYETSKNSDMKLVLDEFESLSHASMNRTKILDDVAGKARNHEWKFSGYSYQKEVLIAHLRDMVRKEEPEKPAVWEKLTKNDHYFHALALFLASLKFRPLVIEQLSGGVGSAFGVASVSAPGFSTIGLPGSSPRSRIQDGRIVSSFR